MKDQHLGSATGADASADTTANGCNWSKLLHLIMLHSKIKLKQHLQIIEARVVDAGLATPSGTSVACSRMKSTQKASTEVLNLAMNLTDTSHSQDCGMFFMKVTTREQLNDIHTFAFALTAFAGGGITSIGIIAKNIPSDIS